MATDRPSEKALLEFFASKTFLARIGSWDEVERKANGVTFPAAGLNLILDEELLANAYKTVSVLPAVEDAETGIFYLTEEGNIYYIENGAWKQFSQTKHKFVTALPTEGIADIEYLLFGDLQDTDTFKGTYMYDTATSSWVCVSGAADTTELEKKIKEVKDDLADNYYKKSETYSQEEVDNLISTIPKFKILIVPALPTEDISKTTIYLVLKDPAGSTQNVYEEWIYTEDDEWEKIGDTEIDLSNYYTKDETYNREEVDNMVLELTELDVDALWAAYDPTS